MRVAVYLPTDHPDHGGGVEGEAVIAFRLGRVEEGVHNAPVGHEPVPFRDYVAGLVSEAKAEYPGARVVVERLVDNGDETASWIAATEFDPQKHTAAGPGDSQAAEVHVEQKGN